jgi:hypothetical protein
MSCCFFGFLTCTNLMSSTQAPISTYIVVCKDRKSGIPLWKGSFMKSKWHFWTQTNQKKCAFENLKWVVTLLPWIPSIFFMTFMNSYGRQFPNEEWLPKIKSCKETYFPPKKPNLFPDPFQCFTCKKIMFYWFLGPCITKFTSAFRTNRGWKFPKNPVVAQLWKNDFSLPICNPILL